MEADDKSRREFDCKEGKKHIINIDDLPNEDNSISGDLHAGSVTDSIDCISEPTSDKEHYEATVSYRHTKVQGRHNTFKEHVAKHGGEDEGRLEYDSGMVTLIGSEQSCKLQLLMPCNVSFKGQQLEKEDENGEGVEKKK